MDSIKKRRRSKPHRPAPRAREKPPLTRAPSTARKLPVLIVLLVAGAALYGTHYFAVSRNSGQQQAARATPDQPQQDALAADTGAPSGGGVLAAETAGPSDQVARIPTTQGLSGREIDDPTQDAGLVVLERKDGNVEPRPTPEPERRRFDSNDAGFVVMERKDGKATAIVHPDGPGWVELPNRVRPAPPPPDRISHGFLGAAAFADCHQDKYDSFVETAHHNTSHKPDAEWILGSFESGKNRLSTKDPGLAFEMTSSVDGFFQQVQLRSKSWRFRFDLVTGSGKMGQTYLHWVDDQLFQMHVTYFRENNSWINSPGFPDGTAQYARPITSQCLSCHSTYFQWVPGTVNRYHKTNYILGISCERCHSPGREHADYHRQNPFDETPKHIVNPGNLSAARVNDICAQCHSGIGKLLQPAFTFRPGEKLDEFVKFSHDGEGVQGGVHTDNQLARLKMSACFEESKAMSGVACHDPHQRERGNLPLFSKRCLQCHETEHCGMAERVGPRITSNCIDCHMPKRRDKDTSLESAGGLRFPLLRDHYIKIRPVLTESVLELMKKQASDKKSQAGS